MNVVTHRAFTKLPDAAAPTIDLFGLSQLLGIQLRGQGWRVRYVQALIDQQNFPKPLPQLRGEELSDKISPRYSRWLRGPVEAWLYGTVPPNLAGVIEDQAAKEAANRLDQAAEALVG